MRLLLIAATLVVSAVIAIPVLVGFQQVDVEMAGLAFLVCVISSLVAHIVGEYPSGDDYFAARLALSLSARTLLPFLVVLMAKLSPAIPFEPGFVLLIILFYFVGMVVDVFFHVKRLKTAG